VVGSIPAKTQKPEKSNLHGFDLHRPSSKGTKLLLQVIKAIINQPEAIEELRKRMTAGAATFLVKGNAHRGEPANEEADIQADKAISSNDVPVEWHDRTNQAVITWQEPRRKGGTLSYEDRKSTWNSGARKAIRRGSAE